MAPKVEPIMLWGFCFTTQSKQYFNQSWACAWHTSWYTDENHPLWDSVDDASKRREIRYGNNIAVLFRALLHCKKFYGQDSLWTAIARGFNTSHTVARVTAEILTDARRVQRRKPARDVSETARAADEWIDWLDSQGQHPRTLSDPEVYKVADAFFKTQEKRLVNAARVPTNSRHSMHLNTSRLHTRELDDEPNFSPVGPSTPSARYEGRDAADNPLFRATRKRSASPPQRPADRSPKFRRLDHDIQARSQAEYGTKPRSEEDQAQSTRPPSSPRRSSHQSTKPAEPAEPAQSTKSEQPAQPVQPSQPAQPEQQPSAPKKEHGYTPSRQLHFEDSSALRARISSLERQLAAAESKPSSTAATAPAPPVQLGEDMRGLKKDMATVHNAVGTMMESMHTIVDSLNLLQEDISGLATQQKEPTTTPPQQTSTAETVVQSIQTIADSVNNLAKEVSELKKQTAEQRAAPVPAAPQSNSKLEGLVQDQNSRIERLAREMASMQAQISTSLPRQTPQNLQQAMAEAERDLSHHLTTVERFYHQLATRGAGRTVTERTAEFLATLQHTVQSAQMGQQGY